MSDTPQDPKMRYWAPTTALPLGKGVLEQLGMGGTLESYRLRAKLEAAYLTELNELAKRTTDGRHALVVNMMMQFQNIVRSAMRAEQDEALAASGEGDSPFPGRVLTR